MKIARDKYPPIIKRKISLKNLISYEKLDINKLNSLLNEVIENYTYNTFDLLDLVKKNYNGDLEDTIKRIKDYKSVRFNCEYASKLLIGKLAKINIKSYLISYKSVGFSNNVGDQLIKEAHMAVVIPTLKGSETYYILMDPGLRIPKILEFSKNAKETIIQIDNDLITIRKTDDEIYNYTMIMEGYNRYSTDNTKYICQEYFDLDHELLNPYEVLFPISFYILFGYRAIRFNPISSKRACIKLMVLEGYLEIMYDQVYKRLSFDDISKLTDNELKELIKIPAHILKINRYKFVNLIQFIISIKEELKNTVTKSVL